MDLVLERHVFRVLANQYRLMEMLGQHSWQFNMKSGNLTFTSQADGRELASCPFQVLGTTSDCSNTWLWSWANEESGIPEALLRGVNKIRRHAEKNNLPLFLDSNEIPMRHERFGAELAIICTGSLELFTYYACGYEGGCLYTGIEHCAGAEERSLSAVATVNVITTAISALDFDHREALFAFLGRPVHSADARMSWNVGAEQIAVSLDSLGRIANLDTVVKPRS